ncbi:MAG: hypothetical protein ACI909_003911, partial [Planctomycetota bacterium]
KSALLSLQLRRQTIPNIFMFPHGDYYLGQTLHPYPH